MFPISIVAVLAATAVPAPAPPARNASPRPAIRVAKPQRSGIAHPHKEDEERPPASDVFSLRARRRFAAYIRMRLLEMREAGLERAADAVERGLTVDQLLEPPK